MAGKESLLNPFVRLDARLHLVLEPEVISSLDEKYSVTCVTSMGVWYSSFMIWSGGVVCESNYGGGEVWVVGWFCNGVL